MAQHLSARQTREFEQILASRHHELREQVHRALMESEDQYYQNLAGRVHDAGEESVADLITDLNFRQTDQLAQEIYSVESAIGRLRTGTYGICIECGGDISLERLQAVPTALRCIDCQRRHELEFSPGGNRTPTL